MRVTGKGNRTRDVFISKDLMKHISEYLEWKRTMDEANDTDSFLLVSSHGRPYSTRALQYAFKVSLEKRVCPNITPYTLSTWVRHLLFSKTKNLRLVQKQLGHSSITTTTIYADVRLEETLEAVNGLFRRRPRHDNDVSDAVPPSDHPT